MFFGFRSSKSKEKKTSQSRQKFGITIVTAGCHFSGKLFCKGASRIAGCIEGEIKSQGLLVIEQEALINAKIVAEEVIIRGKVQGTITASKRVEITAKASFKGNIHSPSLAIQEGAKFNGYSSSDSIKQTEKTDKTENKEEIAETSKTTQNLDNHDIPAPIKLKDIHSIQQSN